jgi:hypothetical protein
MLMLPLLVALSVLAVLILTGIALTYLRFRTTDQRMASIERDLRQFYRDLGRPKAEIINIKAGKRPS